jgi:serine/threonine-protein kinase
MSPEQIRGDKLDAGTDIYALGVLMYEMVTDELPFNADLVGELLSMQMNEAPKPPSEWLEEKGRPRLPPLLEETIMKCLAKNRKERFLSMDELKLSLEMSLDDTDVVTLPIPPPTSKRNWILAAGVATLSVALIVAGTILLWRRYSGDESGKAKTRPPAAGKTVPARSQNGMEAAPKPVVITSVPPQATVFRLRDGKFLGVTPLTLGRAPEKPQDFLIRLKGYKQLTVSIGPEARGTVRVKLQRPAAALPPAVDPETPTAAGTTPADGMKPDEEEPKSRRSRRRRRRRKSGTRRGPPLKDEWGIADPFKKGR